MKIKIVIGLLLLPTLIYADNFSSNTTYNVCFTPYDNCVSQIIATISQAKKEILVQAYSFTSRPIAKALVTAKKRGIDVKVLLDRSQVTNKYLITTLESANINIDIDYNPELAAHNKVIIVDKEVVITGSYNFTKAAEEKNAENLLIIHDPVLARKYATNWQRRAEESISISKYKMLR